MSAATKQVKRIGILTGGGDCPGLNAVIRAVTKSAMFQHNLAVVGIEDGYLGLIENRCRELKREDVSNILTLGGTILGSSNKADPERFATGKDADGKPIFENVTERVVATARKHGLDGLVCIGGDGTMSGAINLIEHGLRCVGVPKTIDNDVMHCEMTFGFQTAVEVASDALDRIHTTASSHHRIMLVEMMGRNAGWLTLYAGVASGADIILIPEIPYRLRKIAETCHERSKHGKRFTIIAISEGATHVGGQVVVDQVVHESPDPIRLGGVSAVLSDEIAMETGLEARATILGHVQRGGTPCPQDRVLGTLFGYAAMNLVVAGRWNELVVMQGNRLTSVPLAEVANRQRLVPPDHPIIQAARAVGVTFGD